MTPPERLIELAALLEADPADWPQGPDETEPRFDLRSWYSCAAGCGTVCCAAGLAGLHPPFQAEGFGLKRTRLSGMSEPVFRPAGDSTELTDWDAVAAFFGLSYDNGLEAPARRFDGSPVARAFYDWCYAPADRTNPKAVAARLRRLAAGDQVDDWDSWKHGTPTEAGGAV